MQVRSTDFRMCITVTHCVRVVYCILLDSEHYHALHRASITYKYVRAINVLLRRSIHVMSYDPTSLDYYYVIDCE